MTGIDTVVGYPVVLDLRGRRCLVVGGGVVATRKVDGLRRAGAIVDVIAPIIGDELEAVRAAAPETITLSRRPYALGDVVGYWLVIAATDDPGVQQAVYNDGERANVWVNAADDPDRCGFILPAVYRRPPVIVAVSSGGASPAIAQWLRDRLVAALPSRLDQLVARIGAERSLIRGSGRSSEGIDWRTRIESVLDELETS